MLIWYQVWFGPKPLSDTAINALFVFNLVPDLSQGIVWASWTIGVEMIFYAMLPVLLAMAPNRTSAFCLALAAVVVSVFARMHLQQAKDLPAIYAHLAFVSNFGIFCMGILAYRLYSHSGNRVRDLRLVMAACVVVTIAVFGPFRTQVFPGRADIILWVLAFGLLTIWQAMRPSFLLSNSFAQFLGERSYSIYLLHPFIIHSLRDTYASIYGKIELPGVSFLICAALSIIIVVICADVTYRLIEVPGIRLGGCLSRYLARRSESALTENA